MHRSVSRQTLITTSRVQNAPTRALDVCRPPPQGGSRRPRSRPVPQEEFAEMSKFSKKMIDAAVRERRGWKHTPSLRGEEKRLASAVKTAEKPTRAPSLEQVAYSSGEVFPEEEESDGSYAPGTFVETRRNELSCHGMVLTEKYVDRRWHVVTLMSSGELWSPIRDDIMFSIPGLASHDLVLRCGTSEVATKTTEINARVEVLKRLQVIEKSVEDGYNYIYQRNIDIYGQLKSSDPLKWSSTTVEDVARLISPNITTNSVFSAHKYLMNNSMHFVAHHPTELVTTRKVIEVNRKIHSESRGERASQDDAPHEWSKDDATILTSSCIHFAPTSAILRRIEPQRSTANDDSVHKILIDLGVLAPWQDLVILGPNLKLDLEPEAVSHRVKEQNALVQKSFSSKPPASGPLGPEDFYPMDPLESVRHDFGDMRVYVIDDLSAEELDDGVSIEQIPSEPENTWIHVHIADPASIIPPTHALAKDAYRRGESMYFLQRSWPLFPRSLCMLPGSNVGLPDRVLTFSMKVNALGEPVDYKVRAGLVHNVQKYTYDMVDLATGQLPLVRTYPFGGGPPMPTSHTVKDEDIRNLRDLQEVADRMVEKRNRDGIFNHTEHKGEIFGFENVSSGIQSPTTQPSYFRGFPEFKYSVATTHALDTGSRNVVAEMMKLACRAASRFCLDHGIPAIRRCVNRVMTANDSDFQKILDMRTPNGFVPFQKILPLITLNPAAEYSLEPRAHFGLGVPDGEGYIRVTSPLRRYADLVAHWQIHHALLGSAAPTAKPPFDAEWLEQFLHVLRGQDRLRKRADGHHRRFWSLMFIKRWMEDTGSYVGSPKMNLDTRRHQGEVQIPLLGIRALLTDLETNDIPLGTTLPVNILDLRLGIRPQLRVCLKQKT
ncbi:hypothetical protein BD779DRAFT_1496070 [Infundibulicybe gibba]|nr:hypothetical protein BD779DRAFT_1496070 [Infundibulicybe gibba]